MYTPAQSVELAVAEINAREAQPTYLWQLAKSTNIPRETLTHMLKERGVKVLYEDQGARAVAYITKADTRKLMGLETGESAARGDR